MNNYILIGLLIPVLGTTLGSAMVFFMKEAMNKKLEKALLGFAAGVMVAASAWSLLIPAIEMSEKMGKWQVMPAAVGFMLGVLFLLVLDHIVPHLHIESDEPEGIKAKLQKTTMMVLAVTLHNFPEGMAVGVVLAGIASGTSTMTLMSALVLSIGIAIQNFPEGAIISMPLKAEGVGKMKAFLMGTASGLVEPLGGLLVIALTSITIPLLPYFLSFAAGAMIYVVIEELIPSANIGKHSNIATMGFAIGFTLMMILDVVLG